MSQEGLAKLWQTGTWRLAATFQGRGLGVHTIAFSPDSRRLATGSVDAEAVKLWDIATQQELLKLPWPAGLVSALAVSPDGTSLICETPNLGLRLWRPGDR